MDGVVFRDGSWSLLVRWGAAKGGERLPSVVVYEFVPTLLRVRLVRTAGSVASFRIVVNASGHAPLCPASAAVLPLLSVYDQYSAHVYPLLSHRPRPYLPINPAHQPGRPVSCVLSWLSLIIHPGSLSLTDQGCLCVNPGQLAKGTGGGTYAEMAVHPMPREMLAKKQEGECPAPDGTSLVLLQSCVFSLCL